jgi:hypothetical protein
VNIPFRYSKGFNPKPRFILPFPLALGLESSYELGELIIDGSFESENFCNLYNSRLPEELKIVKSKICESTKSIASKEFYHDYEIKAAYKDPRNITSALTGVIEGRFLGDVPAQQYCMNGDRVLLRLKGDRSIKSVFKDSCETFLDYSIKRVMIWESKKDSLFSFF